MRIGLHQRRRDLPAGRRVHHRSRDIAAAAQHDVRLPRLEDARARARSPSGQQQRARQRGRGPARQAGDAEGVELVARLRNELSFDAIGRPGERHLYASPLQCFSDR